MKTRSGGFTLMEALATLLVLGLGLMGLLQLQVQLWASTGDLNMQQNAYSIGLNQLEIHSAEWLNIDDIQNHPEISADSIDHGHDQPIESLMTSSVRLSWSRPSGKYALRLEQTINSRLTPSHARYLLP